MPLRSLLGLILCLWLDEGWAHAQQRPQYGPVTIYSSAPASIPLTVKAAVAQTASLQEWRNSANAILVQIRNNGTAIFTGAVTIDGLTNLVGGVQVQTLTTNAFMYPGVAGELLSTAAATNGQLLVGSTGVAPVAATLTGTANRITVTNGAGTITLSAPQDLATASNVTFNNITSNGTLTASTITAPASAGLTISTVTSGDITLTAASNVVLNPATLAKVRIAGTDYWEADATNDATNTAILVYHNGSLKRVKAQTCVTSVNFGAATTTTATCLAF